MPSKADIRALRRVLESRDVASALTAYLLRFKVKRTPSFRIEKQKQKRLGRKEAVAAVRPLALLRADGFCECGCGESFNGWPSHTPEWDEFYGRRYVSLWETWMLTRACHADKTANFPSRYYWDDKFKAHCGRYHYTFRPRLVKAARSAHKGISNG